ncbi:MAG: prolipoprotein diacylglyceryl transferase [Candidatus Pelagibacter sp.]
MFINNFDPVAFQLLSFEIRWYSLSYIFGILLGWIYCKKLLKNNKEHIKLFDDLITYIILGIILGGRLGYVIFYNPIYFLNNLSEIFMIWNGGMSFHGGLLGTIVATYFFSKKKKINSFIFLDVISLSAPIGIFLGRISNFINSELYGRETDVIWGVKFLKIDKIVRHPSQIYEAIFEGIILFILLNFICKKYNDLNSGMISALFLIFYSLFRFLIEFTREPDSHIGFIIFDLSMGQIISIIFLIAGTILFSKIYEFKK